MVARVQEREQPHQHLAPVFQSNVTGYSKERKHRSINYAKSLFLRILFSGILKNRTKI